MSPPPKLSYAANTYLTLSLPTGSSLPVPPSTNSSISSHSSSSQESDSPTSSTHSSSADLLPQLTYVGRVGELQDSHIFSLPVPTENPPPEEVEDVKKWLEEQEGVEDVEFLVPKMKSARKKF